MESINAAIVGAGFMGPVHTEALRRLGIHVTGILGVDEAESKKAALQLGLEKTYHNLDEILNDPEVDVVHLTTPNKLHYPMAKDVLHGGKHVMCEKPLAMNSKESAELVELAKKSGLAAGVNYNMRFYPLNLELKQRIQKGELGEIHSIVGSYVQDWLLYPSDYNWRVLAAEGGALRAVSDIGTHWLDLVQYISGLKAIEVLADVKILHPVRQRPKGEVETFSAKVKKLENTENVNITTEDCASILVRFDNGAVGNLWGSQVTAGRKNCLRYEISGSQKSGYWNSESPNRTWLGNRNRENEELIKDPGLVTDSTRSAIGYPGGHNEGYPDSFKQCFKAFYDYIKADQKNALKNFASFDDGHHEILLCEAILASHKEQRWIKL